MAIPKFEQGTKAEVNSGAAQFEGGAIVTDDIKIKTAPTGAFASGQKEVRVRAVVYPVRDASNGKVISSERIIYQVTKGPNGNLRWEPAAVSLDGGKTYQFSSPRGLPMEKVASDELKEALSDPNETSTLEKLIDKGIIKKANSTPGIQHTDRDVLVAAGTNDAITEAEEELEAQQDAAGGDDDDENTGLTDAQQLEAAKKEFDISSIDIGERGGTRSAAGSFGNHIYPLDLGLSGQDVLKFTMLKYVPSDINMGGGFLGVDTGVRNEDFETLGNREILGTVVLPIPGGISDNNTVSWGSQNMNPAEVAAAQFALNTIMGGLDGATLAAKNLVDAVTGNTGDIKTATGAVIAGAAAGVGQQLITRTTGAVINPSMELLFSGPALRQFQFKFTFTAREREESKEVARIIRFFKQGSAVQRTASNLFLKSPHTFKLQYLFRGPSGGDNPFMGKIKECACTGVSVNYTPQNNYATFSDGAMTSYELSLNFSELEPVYNDEYGSEGELPAAIGF